MRRRNFLKQLGVMSATPVLSSLPARYPTSRAAAELKLSLAQWSLHREIEDGSLDPNDFALAAISRYDLDAVEYVNSFYAMKAEDQKFWLEMRRRADDAGVKSLLIMVDEEGDLGDGNSGNRKTAVDNHHKWVDAAKILGCHSIRVNAFGSDQKDVFQEAMVDGLSRLVEYAAPESINILIENHGLFSSDAQLIADIIDGVNHPNVGTLPDFGNWCLSAKWGSTQHDCDRAYDRYHGVAEFLPSAKAVSAKSYDFDADGRETKIDYYKMLEMVKASDFEGYIGIEYEGQRLSEHEGILATKALLEKVWNSLD